MASWANAAIAKDAQVIGSVSFLPTVKWTPPQKKIKRSVLSSNKSPPKIKYVPGSLLFVLLSTRTLAKHHFLLNSFMMFHTWIVLIPKQKPDSETDLCQGGPAIARPPATAHRVQESPSWCQCHSAPHWCLGTHRDIYSICTQDGHWPGKRSIQIK